MKVDRQKWLAERRKGIGSSDLPVVLGIAPYADATPTTLYMEKVGLDGGGDDEKPEYVSAGNRLEPVIADMFAENHPEYQVVMAPFVRSAVHPWIQANPDRLLLKDGVVVGVLECKNAGGHQRKYWGESGTDFAPPAFHAQVSWSAIALLMNPKRVFEEDHPLPPIADRLERWIAVLIGGSDYREYPIGADAELDGMFVEHGQRFMANHVIPNIPPQIDGSKSSKQLLDALYPKETDPLREATNVERKYMEQLKGYLATQKKVNEAVDDLKNKLRESIGTSAGIIAVGLGQITNKASKDGQAVNTKALLADPALPKDLVLKHTETKAGSRRFLPKWEEGETE